MTHKTSDLKFTREALVRTFNRLCNAKHGFGTNMLDEGSDLYTRGQRHFFEEPVKADFGIFRAVVRQAQVTAYFEVDDETGGVWASFSLGDKHHGGGSNGSDIVTIWLTKDGEFGGARWPDGVEVLAATI